MTQFKIWKFQTNMFHYHFIYVSSADFQLLISHSASFYVQYQNTNHIPAAAIISVNQHQLMYLTALFQIQMKHLCEKAIAVCPSSHRWWVCQNDAIGHYLTSQASDT